ncbi:TPA: hypothetical protein DIS56_02400 [Candidatus Saccharibacteria bacterium]|nr:MAG: hypothetical protein A3F05_03325 [Candidatus Saccharibacteria bacterium RIFCSPHIGHO2_12_FULL_47_17]HCM51961.1 hypothetical protein [Candidatus Saccharibacteria bacterium]
MNIFYNKYDNKAKSPVWDGAWGFAQPTRGPGRNLFPINIYFYLRIPHLFANKRRETGPVREACLNYTLMLF